MNCPVCDATLREVTKMGVQVDICPDCKGVWLDRGELDKIIQIVEQGGGSAPMPEQRPEPRHDEYRANDRPEPRREDYRTDDRRDYHDHDRDHRDDSKRPERRYDERGREIDPRTGRPKKREGILGEIFDMFGD